MLLPDVPLWYAPLAAFYGFLLWGTRVVRSMNDALGLTVPGELLRSGVNLLGAIIILALFWFGFLNAGSLFGLQYLMMGSIVIGCLVIMRRSWAHIDLSLTRDQRLSYTREFSDYSMPLFVQALLSGAGPFRRTLGAPVVRRQHTARLFRAVPTRQRRVFSVRIRHDPVDHA